MEQRMSWEQIKKRYPDEWVLITDYEMTKYGEIKDGILVAHSKSKEDVFSYPTDADKVGLLFTGAGNFRGLRSHVERDNEI